MANISAHEKNMILLAVLVVALALVYKYFAEPYYDKWNSVTTQISQMETRLTRAKQLKANANMVLYAENTVKNQTATIAVLLENLETWSNQAGLKISGVKPGANLDKTTYRELDFDIEVTGELENVCKLVDSIEQPQSLARIDKIRISKPKDLLKDLTTVITVSTICLPEVKPVNKKPAAAKDSDEL
jgi:Tfp pilus assembly protein PilO